MKRGVAMERLAMSKVREILRLRWAESEIDLARKVTRLIPTTCDGRPQPSEDIP